MIDVLLIALAQVAAGDPTPPPAQPPEATATEQAEEPAIQEEVVCRTRPVLGSRVHRERVCTTASQDEEARQALTDRMRRNRNRGALRDQTPAH